MSKKSAGILLYRKNQNQVEVFLIHPGGPFWKNKDNGAWSIPKGEYDDLEDAFDAALREFKEETGHTLQGNGIPLTPVIMKSGKHIQAFAMEGDLNASEIQSNLFEMEWPPKSGKKQSFPEVDKASWFDVQIALKKINTTQAGLINELQKKLK